MPERPLAVAFDCLFPFTTGGGERQYRGFAERMVARGRSVDYLTSQQWEGAVPCASFRPIAVTGRLRLYDDAGVRRSAAALRYATGLFRWLVRHRRTYDGVVVSGLPVLNVFAARGALLGSRTPMVVDYLEVWGRAQWVTYAGRRTGTIAWLLQRAAIALTPVAACHSQLSADRLRREGFRRRILVSPGLIDASGAVPEPGEAATPPYALYAGRHIPDKQVDVLPAAVAAARAHVPDLRLVVLGAGPSTDDVRTAVDRAGGEDWTELPGFVDDARLAELFSGAACLVNPSRREGYGLVVVEAAAHGTPSVLVAHEDNAATELVDDGVNGFVASSTSPDELARALVAAVQGGDHLRESTRRWYLDALTSRTLDRTVEALLAALDTMKSRPRRSRATGSPAQQGSR